MRISDNMTYNQVNRNLGSNRAKIAHLQNQAATQKKLTRPSEDPVAAARVLNSKTNLHQNMQFIKNANFAQSFLNYSDVSLADLSDMMIRVKELLLGQVNDASANRDSRGAVAEEIEQIFDQAVQIGNRRLGDRYLFGGYKTTDPPFSKDGKYLGDDGIINIEVNPGSYVSFNLPGNQIFHGVGLSSMGQAALKADNNPHSVEELQEQRQKAQAQETEQASERGRTPASQQKDKLESPANWQTDGVNIFQMLRSIVTGLKTSDKGLLQQMLDQTDEAISQVVLARANLGSKAMNLNKVLETELTSKVQIKGTISHLEDADAFEVVSDLNKVESTLQASLATSGKLIQPSLLDFLR